MDKKYYFLSGLPRSGSTLLAALLSQNPNVFVSVTSPLLEFLGSTEQTWRQIYQSYTCPFPNHLQDISLGLLDGFYKSVKKPVVIDKSRGWSANIPRLATLLNQPPKVICTVRDLPSVVASFYRLFENESKGESNIDKGLLSLGRVINKQNRCQHIWDSLIKGPWMAFMHGYKTTPQCVHLVEYEALLSDPQATMEGVYRFLDLPLYSHDFQNITQPIVEDDSKWGIKDLHKIGRKLERQHAPANERLGEEIYKTYADLNLEFWRAPRL